MSESNAEPREKNASPIFGSYQRRSPKASRSSNLPRQDRCLEVHLEESYTEVQKALAKSAEYHVTHYHFRASHLSQTPRNTMTNEQHDMSQNSQILARTSRLLRRPVIRQSRVVDIDWIEEPSQAPDCNMSNVNIGTECQPFFKRRLCILGRFAFTVRAVGIVQKNPKYLLGINLLF